MTTTLDTSEPQDATKTFDSLKSGRKRSLLGACVAHLLHDGYTDQLYVLLPIWQSTFGLSYTGLALVRALYWATMGGLQMPANKYTSGLGTRAALTLATLVAAAGYLVVALPLGFGGLCLGLVIAGVGSSLQHPRASLLITDAFGSASRGPLGIYNFAGDLGKSTFPAIVALLLPLMNWRTIVGAMALVGVTTALALLSIIPAEPCKAPGSKPARALRRQAGRGFNLLIAIGAFDTAARMGYLLFLPFLIHAKGGAEASVGIGLALLFAGGAFGKACCGWLGQRFGVVRSVIVTEASTSVLMLATLGLPLAPVLITLPLLGIVLNGTSSVLYGTVPEFAQKDDLGRAFALFYTGVIASGGLAPIGYGVLADHAGRTVGVVASALTAAVIIPMIMALRIHLGGTSSRQND